MAMRATSEFCMECGVNKRKFQRTLCQECFRIRRREQERSRRLKNKKKKMKHFSLEFLRYRGINMSDKKIVYLDGNSRNKKSTNIIVVKKIHHEKISKVLKFCKKNCLEKGNDWSKEVTLRIFLYIKRNIIPFIRFNNGIPNVTEI